jgi:hypothetical protein
MSKFWTNPEVMSDGQLTLLADKEPQLPIGILDKNVICKTALIPLSSF